MRTRISGVLVALAIALLVPTAAVAADTPVSVYHGTWQTAAWDGSPDTCPMVFFGTIPAAGNWNVTILPGGARAVVHITMFATLPNPDTGGDRIKVDSWGGDSFGQFWTVDSTTSNGFALHMDLGAAYGWPHNTFALDGTKLTFTIAPWVAGPFSCAAAIAYGTTR